MKKLLLLLIIPFLSFGQGWIQSFDEGNNFGIFVEQTSDGGYIITGGGENIFLLKTTENGEQQWFQEFGGRYGRSVQQTSDGGYILCGHSVYGMYSNADLYLIKTDETGEEIWTTTFSNATLGGDAISVQQTSDGGYILCGIVNSTYQLIKTDESGEEVWSQNIDNDVKDMQKTIDGGYILLSFDGLIKLDENGEEVWSQTFSNLIFSPSRVQPTTDGGYIITGGLAYSSSTETGYFGDIYLLKTNEFGEEQWSQTFGENGGANFGNDVRQTTDGGYIITGTTSTNGSQICCDDVYIIKTDENGVEEWSQTFGGDDAERGNSVRQTSDGGYIITGIQQIGFSDNIYLIKVTDFGNITSTIEYFSINKNLITTIDILGRETNKKGFQLHIYDDGSVEKKYLIK